MQSQMLPTQMFEMYRAGLKNAADMMSASFENAQRLQQQQLEVLHTAIDDQVKSMRELSEVRSMDELVTLQSRLTGAQFERAVELWSRMWRAAGDNQSTMLGQAREGVRSATVSTSTSVSNAVREATQQERKQQERRSA